MWHTASPVTEYAIFVATSLEQIPAGTVRFASVDGTVPGAAVVWDHHRSGEPVNLDAMPAVVDPTAFDGVATTLADADAVISAAVFLLGGTVAIDSAHLPVLRSAAHWCDHLLAAPGDSESLAAAGLGLSRAIDAELGAGHARRDHFGAAVHWLTALLKRKETLPCAPVPPQEAELAERLEGERRIHVDAAPVALVDLQGFPSVPPLACYGKHRCPVAVTVDVHPHGGVRYTVGVNPFVPERPTDLGAALAALAAVEYAKGPPARSPEPIAGNENWGGRATVFGSPWNYGSRLTPEQVVAVVRKALGSR